MEPFIPQTSPRVFTVEWNVERLKFIALDDLRENLGLSANRASAIGIAILAANNASRTGSRVAVRVLLRNGTYRTEYIAQPAHRRP